MESTIAFVQLLFTLSDGTHVSIESGVVFGDTESLTLCNAEEQVITHPDGQLAQNLLIKDLTHALEKIYSQKVQGVYLSSFIYETHRMDILHLPEGCVLSAVFPINYSKPTYSFWINPKGNIKQVF